MARRRTGRRAEEDRRAEAEEALQAVWASWEKGNSAIVCVDAI